MMMAARRLSRTTDGGGGGGLVYEESSQFFKAGEEPIFIGGGCVFDVVGWTEVGGLCQSFAYARRSARVVIFRVFCARADRRGNNGCAAPCLKP